MWPFSDMSLSTATWWFDSANLVLLGSLLFGVLSTFAIVRLANVKERHWDIARDQSRERVTGLEAELGQAQAAIADANARALEAQAALGLLRKHVAPRRLIPNIFLKALQGHKKAFVRFMYPRDDAESFHFAVDALLLLKQANWSAADPAPIPYHLTMGSLMLPITPSVGVNPTGVTIVVKSLAEGDKEGTAFKALENAFRENLGAVWGTTFNHIPADTLLVVIAPRL